SGAEARRRTIGPAGDCASVGAAAQKRTAANDKTFAHWVRTLIVQRFTSVDEDASREADRVERRVDGRHGKRGKPERRERFPKQGECPRDRDDRIGKTFGGVRSS